MNQDTGAVNLTAVKVVSFDADGTLWDLNDAMRQALERAAIMLSAAGLRHDGMAITAGWLKELRDDVARQSRFEKESMERIRHESFAEALRRCGSSNEDLLRQVYDSYMTDRFALLKPYPEVAHALQSLGQTRRLVLITNGNSYPELVGMAEVFSLILVAYECGLFKPDPAIYAHAAGLLGVEPEQCLHVGDDPTEDVVAAHRAGMRTAWVNRDGRAWPFAEKPDLTVHDLDELLTAVGN